MSVYAGGNSLFHRETCGRDGAPCPTGEHGFCTGCLGDVPVGAPIAEHDTGCPAVEHCPGCAVSDFNPDFRGHGPDCPCAYDDHRVPETRSAAASKPTS